MSYGRLSIYKKNKKLIESKQRRATRMIPELKGLSYTDRLQHLKLFSKDYRRKRGDMIQLFKILNGFENIDAQTMFTFATSQTRGHNKKLYKSRCAKGFRQHSFCIRSIDQWNRLSHNVIDSSTVNEFKINWTRNGGIFVSTLMRCTNWLGA